MKNRLVLGVTVIVVVAVSFSTWILLNHLDYLGKTKHETTRWAAIVDSKRDIMSVETTFDDTWDTLVALHQNQSEMWIGGVVEEYDSNWGFRFKPDTIVVAEITVEGAQTYIQGISEDLNYWINVWTKEAYVLARVQEIHG